MSLKNSSNSSGGDKGNTNQSPPSKQCSPAVRWCFTVNNYTEDDIENVRLICSNSSKYYAFSKEIGESGTPHLQGYIEFKKKCRPKGMFKNETIHWEKSKGNKKSNFDYITKEKKECWINGKHHKSCIESFNPLPWQKKIIDIVSAPADARTINWIWESQGNVGKSWLCKWLCINRNALILSNKASDMKNGIMGYLEKCTNYPDIIIIDIPRSVDCQYISFTGIEEIKNGCFFSPKYEGGMCIMPYPHIVIMSNEAPPLDELSKDRWGIMKI